MSAVPKWSVLSTLLAATAVAAASWLPIPAAAAGFATSDDTTSTRSEAYREGQRALERERWDDAARSFAAVAAAGGAEVDSALYWKAYADWKSQRRKDALAGIRALLAAHPQSPWADDARALELEIRGGGDPAEVADEELKLYALDALLQVEPARALPVLERILAGDGSPRIKERALFVLAQSDEPRAREILVRIARTGEPAGLRVEAVRTLGIAGEQEDIAALSALLREGTTPPEVRAAVIEAYLISDRVAELAALAQGDADPGVRRQAIEALGALQAHAELRGLWASERDPEVRRRLLEALAIAGDVESLARAARDPGAPDLRRQAIEGLAITGTPEAGRELRALYGELSDPGDRRKVLEAFMIRGDARALSEQFRVERDPALRREIVQLLSVMDDEEAGELLLSILGEKP